MSPAKTKLDIDEISLNTRAKRATPNRAQLRLYADSQRRLMERNAIEEAKNGLSDDISLNTRAKHAHPNKAQLRLYSSMQCSRKN